MFALESEQITKKQFHEAYMIAHQIMAEFELILKDSKRKSCTALIKLMQRLKKIIKSHKIKLILKKANK